MKKDPIILLIIIPLAALIVSLNFYMRKLKKEAYSKNCKSVLIDSSSNRIIKCKQDTSTNKEVFLWPAEGTVDTMSDCNIKYNKTTGLCSIILNE